MPPAVFDSTPGLLDRAWDRFALDPLGCIELCARVVAQAQAEGDARAEALATALPLLARAVRRGGDEPAATLRPAVAAARARCLQLDCEAAAWLCDEAEARLDISSHHFEEASARLLTNLVRPGRSLRERYVTLHGLQRLAEHQGDFDEALRVSYELIELARGIGPGPFLTHAKYKLACLQLNLLNLEHGLPLHDEAHAEFEAFGITSMRVSKLNSHVLTSHFRRMPEQGYAAVQAWRAQFGMDDPETRYMLASPVALAAINVGRLDEAEAALAAGEPLREREWPDQVCMRIWIRGLLRCAQGRHAEAREMCQRFLDSGARTSPANLMQLHSVIAQASEALGDLPAALQATRQAMATMTPMVGHSARAFYQSVKIEQAMAGEPVVPEVDAQRMRALQQAVDRQAQEVRRSVEPPVPVPAVAQPAPPPGPDPQRRFVAQVSHEMRSQLNGLLGMTSLLMMSELDERQSRYVSLARSSAQHLLELANDILDLAKLEAGRFELELRHFSLRELVAEVSGLYEGEASSRGIALRWEVATEVADHRHGAALRLRQVLTNLVANALRFTDHGSVQVRVMPLVGERLRFEVADSGVGLGRGAEQRLFQEFAQEPDHRGGTGLGLALSRQLVQHMGGTIGVVSAPGEGSTFWFELPLRHAEAGPTLGAVSRPGKG
ncbi:ATP-binding protein [Ideonella sp. DXS29W]|uniref:histidine kinase n=1 Tax=Ideonella lacteola TaxID=2984193 RepID=A0ABU9BXK1_9BURK